MSIRRIIASLAGAIIALALLVSSLPLSAQESAPKTYQKLYDENWVVLQVPIPFPGCGRILGDKTKCCDDTIIQDYYTAKNSARISLGQSKLICPSGSLAAVKDMPAFIIVIVQFLTIVVLVMMVLYLILAGILYITSRGNAEKAKKSLESVKHATFGLVIALFSSVILYQVNPALINLEMGGVIGIEQAPETPASEDPFSCNKFASKSTCDANADQCQFDPENGICIAKRSTQLSACAKLSTDAFACLSATGCTWDIGCFPRINLQTPDQVVQNSPCYAKQKDQCTGECTWNSGCLEESIAYAKKCSDYRSQDSCPISHCTWIDNACSNALIVSAPCSDSESCGPLNYCQTNPNNKSFGTCQRRRSVSSNCGGLLFDSRFTNDRVCLSGDCQISVENTCSGGELEIYDR